MKNIVLMMMCLVALFSCSADTEFDIPQEQPQEVLVLKMLDNAAVINDVSLTLSLYNGYVVMSSGTLSCKMQCSINGDEYKVTGLNDNPTRVWKKFCNDVISKGNVDEGYFKVFNPYFDDLYFGGMTGRIKKAGNALTLTVTCVSTNEMNGMVLHDEEFMFVKIR